MVKNIDLSIGSVGTHDFLFDRLSDSDLLHEVVQGRKLLSPFFGRDDLDDTRLHAVRIDLRHLWLRVSKMLRGQKRTSATYEFLKILELVHIRLEDRDISRPMIREDITDIFVYLLGFSSWGVFLWVCWVHVGSGILQVAEVRVVASIELHRIVTIGWRMKAGGFVRVRISIMVLIVLHS